VVVTATACLPAAFVARMPTRTAHEPKIEQVNEAAFKMMQAQKETDAKLQRKMQQLGATSKQLVKRLEKATAPVVATVKMEVGKAAQAVQAEIPTVTDALVEVRALGFMPHAGHRRHVTNRSTG